MYLNNKTYFDILLVTAMTERSNLLFIEREQKYMVEFCIK